jgi:hypothetical protein
MDAVPPAAVVAVHPARAWLAVCAAADAPPCAADLAAGAGAGSSAGSPRGGERAVAAAVRPGRSGDVAVASAAAVRVWRGGGGGGWAEPLAGGGAGALAWAPSGARLAVARPRGVALLDIARATEAALPGAAAAAWLRWAPDERALAAGCGPAVLLWPVGAAAPSAPARWRLDGPAADAAWSADARVLAVLEAHGDAAARVHSFGPDGAWRGCADVRAEAPLAAADGPALALAWSSPHERLAVGFASGRVALFAAAADGPALALAFRGWLPLPPPPAAAPVALLALRPAPHAALLALVRRAGGPVLAVPVP